MWGDWQEISQQFSQEMIVDLTRMVGGPVVSSWIQGRAYLTVELRVFGARQTVGLVRKGLI